VKLSLYSFLHPPVTSSFLYSIPMFFRYSERRNYKHNQLQKKFYHEILWPQDSHSQRSKGLNNFLSFLKCAEGAWILVSLQRLGLFKVTGLLYWFPWLSSSHTFVLYVFVKQQLSIDTGSYQLIVFPYCFHHHCKMSVSSFTTSVVKCQVFLCN
jgi:hypothetical protein